MKIIPAIDIINGKCVRLTQGDYAQKVEYSDDPLQIAKTFEEAGLNQLHLVDLDGAKSDNLVNAATLQSISENTNLAIDFGGGIKSNGAILKAFKSGAKQVTVGSIAVRNRELVQEWIKAFGTEKIILGADVKDEKIAINGWQDNSGLNVFEFITDYVALGIKHCICTDVSKDGLLEGPSFDLYERILKEYPTLKLIASGGVSDLGDLQRLEQIGVSGTIVGKAYYEGRISLEELASFEN